MITPMTRYDFILLSSGTEAFLEKIQSLGVVDITRSVKPVDNTSGALFDKITALKAEISDIEKGSDAHLSALSARRSELEKEAATAEIWGAFDSKAVSDLESRGLKLNFYSVQSKKYDPEWEQQYPIQVIAEQKGYTYFVVVGAEDFPLKALPAPARSSEAVRAEIEALDAEIEEYRSKLADRSSELPGLKAKLAGLSAELDRYLAGAATESAAEDHLTVVTGFAPSENDEALKAEFDKLDAFYVSADAALEDNPPIKLKNNKFVSMFEVLTDMYGRPAYNGFDPTPYISIFFLLFFAMCMGDAGYGIILIIIGLLLRKVKSFASLAPLVVTLGGATVVVGFFFHTFFSMDISSWAIIPDALKSVMVPAKVATYDGTMILALAVGIVHLCLAMIVKTVYATRNQGFLNSLGTWGWTLFIVGGVVVAMISLMGVIDAALTKIIVIVLGVLSGLGIFLLNNLHRNPLLNIGAGLWEAYNTATGVLGDVLSYLRLYALGLAGSMLGFAFNDLAKMALGDGGVGGWIAFVLIVVIGHTLNLAMAALGAFVHPLRLNFLEFFKNSGYEGVGRNYNPLKKNN
ncbi:MAG: ATPase V [Bacteroidales bacterium]|nr:ATPase V [Bacteroidales bacterium]